MCTSSFNKYYYEWICICCLLNLYYWGGKSFIWLLKLTTSHCWLYTSQVLIRAYTCSDSAVVRLVTNLWVTGIRWDKGRTFAARWVVYLQAGDCKYFSHVSLKYELWVLCSFVIESEVTCLPVSRYSQVLSISCNRVTAGMLRSILWWTSDRVMGSWDSSRLTVGWSDGWAAHTDK